MSRSRDSNQAHPEYKSRKLSLHQHVRFSTSDRNNELSRLKDLFLFLHILKYLKSGCALCLWSRTVVADILYCMTKEERESTYP
jgi:hypothetical protein